VESHHKINVKRVKVTLQKKGRTYEMKMLLVVLLHRQGPDDMTSKPWTIRLLSASDIPAALRLSMQAGWEDVETDWRRVLDWEPNGCFAAEINGQVIGTVTTIRYETDLGWIGYMLVDLVHRRRGVGTSLMTAALKKLEGRVACIMLDASAMGRPVYSKFGFRSVYAVNDWVGTASLPHAECPTITDDCLPAIADFDLPRFGADRRRVLYRLASEFPHLARVDLDRNGNIQGYLLGYRRGRLIQIGPWVHEDPQGAARLLGSVSEASNGRPFLIRVPEVNTRVTQIVRLAGLKHVSSYTRMILGNASPSGKPESICSITSLAVG